MVLSLNPLYKVFNSAAHLVSRTPRFSPTSPSLVLHWLHLKYRVIFKICLIMFKVKNKISTVYLTNSIRVRNRSGLRSSSFNHNSVYRVKRSFFYSGLFFWNYLPSSLTLTKSLTLFRKGLKTHLFGKFVSERSCSPRKGRYKELY